MTDGPSDSTSSKAVSETAADDFQPDVPPDLQVGTVSAPEPPTRSNGEPSADPDLETTHFGAAGDPMESAAEPSPRQEILHLVPGAMARLGTRTPGALAAGDLHQPTFDIDERAIGIGVRVLAALTARGDEPPYPHKAAEYVGGPGDSPPPAD